MQLYCGIDLHSNNSLISIVDEDDKIVAERRLNNTVSGIQSYLEPFQQAITGIGWWTPWLIKGIRCI